MQLFDRSPVCTLALAVYSVRDAVFDRRVFFVRLLGFITPTAARRIGLADSERFERIHEEVYRDLGYELVEVPPAPVEERLALLEGWLSKFTRSV